MNKALKNCLLVISLAAYTVLFLYFQNIEEVNFKEVSGILVVFIVIGAVVYGMTFLIFKRLNLGAVVSCILIVFLYNYMMIQSGIQLIFPRLKYWHILPIVAAIVLHIIYFLRKISEEKYNNIILVLQITVLGLLFINVVPAIPRIAEKWKVASKQVEMESSSADHQKKENVYWFIFDECASFATMEKYYDYHDKTVFHRLQDLKFTISDNGKNECGNTDVVLTNCLNLEYVANTRMDAIQLNELRTDSKLTAVFAENGYEVRGIGDTEWLGIKSINQENLTEAKTVEGKNIVNLILQNTVLSPFLQFDGTASAKLILDTFAYVQKKENIQANSSQFNVVYMCTPHQPFLFDRNGGAVNPANYDNWEDEKYYLDQYIFVMDQMVQTVENIIENDPESIIIVQSDHGPRFNNEMPEEDKIAILNTVYFKGEDIPEIVGKSGVNTLRTIVNRLFGYHFEDLEVKESE